LPDASLVRRTGKGHAPCGHQVYCEWRAEELRELQSASCWGLLSGQVESAVQQVLRVQFQVAGEVQPRVFVNVQEGQGLHVHARAFGNDRCHSGRP